MNTPGTFCENCGASLRAGSRFCEACGQPVGAGGGASAPPAAPAAPSLVCATCCNGDQVVAASAYAAATDPEVAGDDDRVPPEMVASFLEKPDKPTGSTLLGWIVAPLIPLVLFFVYWFAPIHRGFKFFLFGWTVALFYHLFNGIRHLAWDAGKGFDLRHAYLSGMAVIASAVAATALAWAVGLAR